jgi:uncharacterized protein YjdB
MSYTVTHHKSNQKFLLLAIIVLFTVTIISSMPEVFAQGTYYVGGSGAADTNPGSSTQPFLTINKAATVAPQGSVVNIRSGTYRETIVPVNGGITFQPDQGAVVTVSGLDQITTSWTVHSGNIYKTTITNGLPVDNAAGYNLSISNSNTTLFNNQIFKDGAMMFEARYPNITNEADLLDLSKMRHYSQISSFNTTQLVDNGIPTTGLAGAKMPIYGWFWNHMRTVTSQSSQNTLNFSAINNSDGLNKYRHYYYVCGKLVLLDAAKEWHYDNATNTLYLWQPGGGSPTGVEYKARNWGFDLRGVDNVTIKGLTFIGCEVARGDTNTDGCTIDNVRASYTNHDVMYEDLFPGYGNATETGTQLLGSNNTVKNSEFRYTAAHGIFVGHDGLIQNNKYQDCGYDGSWGAPFSFAGSNSELGTSAWPDADGVKILYNTVSRTGRSAVDLSPSYTGGGEHDNHNIEIAYNDFSMWGMVNVDLGAIYGWGFRDMTGSTIHHNWFHDDGVVADPSGEPLHGGQYAIYFDQASGPFTVHHNIASNCWTGLPTNAGDTYNQPNFEHRNAGSSKYYNNSFMSEGPYSHKVSVNSPKDIWRNNICAERLNMNWTNAEPADEQYNLFDGEVSNTASVPVGTGTVENADFSGTNIFAGGSGSLAFVPSAGSIARNTGVVIAGITDDDDGTPDKGAYKFGDAWVPGYVAVPFEQSVAVTGVQVSPATASIGISGKTQLNKIISPSNATNQNVTWSSNAPGVATVNSTTGLVTGVAEGSATITATTQDGSFTDTSIITVEGTVIDDAVIGTGVNQHNYTGSGWVHAATQPTFHDNTLSFSNVTNASMTISFVGSKIEWYTEKMNHHGIVAVSIDNGTETNIDLYAAAAVQQQLVYTSPAMTPGSHTFKIRATGTKNAASTGFYAIHDFVRVYTGTAVTGVTVFPSAAAVVVGGTLQLSKTIAPSNASNQNVTWTSSNTNVATVNSSSGLVTGVALGNATITATTQDGSFTSTCAVSVHTSVAIFDDAVIGTGVNQHNYTGSGWVHAATQPTFYNSTLSFSNVTNAAMTISFVGSRIEWYTENMNHHGIVAVSIDNGTEVNVDLYAATAVQQRLVYISPVLTQGSHTFKIRATGTKNAASTGFYAIHDFVKVYSNNILVSNLSVDPAAATILVGGVVPLQLSTVITPGNATNPAVTWTSSAPSIATVNSTGQVTAVAAGTATVTATTTDGTNISASSTVTVIPKGLIVLKFNDATGSAPANTGTVTSTFTKSTTPSWSTTNVPANVGGASSLDFGTTTGNNYVESSAVINELKSLSSFTLTGWVNCKSSTMGSGGNRIISWINNGGDGVDLVYKNDGSLQLGIDQWPDTSPAISNLAKITTDAGAAASNWRFFAVTYQSSSNEVSFYFGSNTTDATLDVTRTYNRGAVGTNTNKLAIGHFNSATRAGALDRMFRGLIDDVQIHGSALTLPGIVAIQRGLGGSSSGGGGQRMAAFENVETSEPLRAYSNPVKRGGILKFDLPTVPGELRILDAVGRLNFSLQVTDPNLEIPTGNLATGVYILHYKTSTGRYFAKIVVD